MNETDATTEREPLTFPHDFVLDTRDLHDLLDSLRSEDDAGTLDADEAELLGELCNLEASVVDWQHGEALVRDDYFEDYARELAEDVGAVDRDAAWPMTCIDWPAAARALLQDYYEFEIDGRTYYAR